MQWISAPRFRGDKPRGNDGHAGRLSIAKVARCLTGFLHCRAVRGHTRCDQPHNPDRGPSEWSAENAGCRSRVAGAKTGRI